MNRSLSPINTNYNVELKYYLLLCDNSDLLRRNWLRECSLISTFLEIPSLIAATCSTDIDTLAYSVNCEHLLTSYLNECTLESTSLNRINKTY